MEKRGGFIRLAFSILLGFLPSFVFVSMFIQYGSPFSNYVKFLSNLNTSWWVWIAAIILMLVFYSVFGLMKSRKEDKKPRNKFLVVVIILFLLVAIALVGSQVYLYAKFALGSDLLVRLSADKDNIFFGDNPIENVTFKVSVTMNPFCTAECQYEFFDISRGNVIENGSFNMTSIFSKYKTYILDRGDSTQSQVLNKFNVICKTKRARFCYTSGEEIKRTTLITLNYDLNQEENKFKNDSKEEIVSLNRDIYILDTKINNSGINLNKMNNSLDTELFLEQLNILSDNFFWIKDSPIKLKELWEAQNFLELAVELPKIKNKVQNIALTEDNLNSGIFSNISFYNNLAGNITILKQLLKNLYLLNLTNESCQELDNEIINFNENIETFLKKSDLKEKELIFENISSEVNEVYENYQEDNNYVCSHPHSISNTNITQIEIISVVNESIPIPTIYFNEKEYLCCFYGKCERCCDENCTQKNYPIIFLHGHSVNKALPADYSLDTFAKIKKRLEYVNYIDAGAIVISQLDEQKGLLGRINNPIEVTASYYFDSYKEENGEELIVPSKTDSIDTYAIRLNDIIKLIKYRTNKDKVIIVAHSMGGLVTRKYAEIFGGGDIDKAILIDTPNHGIDEKIKNSCSLLGPEAACNDMDKNSIFINKLNNANPPEFPIYNIIGVGCYMGDETGDGIVRNSSQYLSYAINYYIEGNCDELSFRFLHQEILDPDKYPQILEIISETISK